MAAIDPSMLASIGSLGAGAADFGMGNITGILNFLQGLKGAHHRRQVGDKIDKRRQARMAGDPNWHQMDVSVSPNEDMQAVLADLLPFGIGENIGRFAYPSPQPQAESTPTRR